MPSSLLLISVSLGLTGANTIPSGAATASARISLSVAPIFRLHKEGFAYQICIRSNTRGRFQALTEKGHPIPICEQGRSTLVQDGRQVIVIPE